jgi:hypothetical protein
MKRQLHLVLVLSCIILLAAVFPANSNVSLRHSLHFPQALVALENGILVAPHSSLSFSLQHINDTDAFIAFRNNQNERGMDAVVAFKHSSNSDI